MELWIVFSLSLCKLVTSTWCGWHPHPLLWQVVPDFWLEGLQWPAVLSRPWSSTSLRHLLDEKILDPQRRVKVGRNFLHYCLHSFQNMLRIFLVSLIPHRNAHREVMGELLKKSTQSLTLPMSYLSSVHNINTVMIHHHHCYHGWEEGRGWFSIVTLLKRLVLP